MGRTDSGIGDELGFVLGPADANDDFEKPLNIIHSETKVKGPTHPHSLKRHTTSPTTPRKHSVSSTGHSKTRSTGSRSSSLHSRRTRRDELRPRRIHSSPYGALPRSNIEEAMAFHEQSCKLMESLSISSRIAEPTNAPVHRVTSAPYLITPPLIHPQARGPASYPQQHPELADKPTGAFEVDSPACSVVHWTSAQTRRKEYAEIDKRNSGFRKFVRKLVPGCLSKPAKLDFYEEKDGSDVGSVRRYRLDLPDD